MLFRKGCTKPQTRIDCLIGAGTEVEGNVTFSGGLRVDGHVKGNVTAADERPTTITLSEQARVEGEIRVSHAVINGTVVGPVHAGEYVELQAKARVTGDVFYKTLEVHLGAVIQGRLIHRSDEVPDKVVAFKPASGD